MFFNNDQGCILKVSPKGTSLCEMSLIFQVVHEQWKKDQPSTQTQILASVKAALRLSKKFEALKYSIDMDFNYHENDFFEFNHTQRLQKQQKHFPRFASPHCTRSKNFKTPFFQRYFKFLPVSDSNCSKTSPKFFFQKEY